MVCAGEGVEAELQIVAGLTASTSWAGVAADALSGLILVARNELHFVSIHRNRGVRDAPFLSGVMLAGFLTSKPSEEAHVSAEPDAARSTLGVVERVAGGISAGGIAPTYCRATRLRASRGTTEGPSRGEGYSIRASFWRYHPRWRGGAILSAIKHGMRRKRRARLEEWTRD